MLPMSNVVTPPLHSFCNTAEALRVASYILGYACHDMHLSLSSSRINPDESAVLCAMQCRMTVHVWHSIDRADEGVNCADEGVICADEGVICADEGVICADEGVN